ncbi:YpiF family protein [Caldibacillus lycopersici]|uniref:YpiF family protein n=1 Tax=Perspicuibacillus lycopersici TaxID=1325689 RepID=A0AAE3IUL1_9BACI|nr:YpiF family protein [Perspicuibacillus lycopersici]MCU9613701.1 YpiF family protein [Perspicuibacillus lycopersici]
MRWTAKESALFFESKEYIDTALVPLTPIAFDEQGRETGNANEFIQLITMNIEKQFKGRILLLPAFTYFHSESDDWKNQLLASWLNELKSNFKHVFIISTDQSWKPILEKSGNEFIWLPAVPLEHLEDEYKTTIIEGQVKQLLNLFVMKWQNAVSQ